MRHRLAASVTLDDGSAWQLHEEYCGAIDGGAWQGSGTFELTGPGDDSFHGTFTSFAVLPTTGEPYKLTVTGGTGRFTDATGTCDVDNHIEDTAAWGQSRQFGDFTCELELSATSGD